MVMVVLFLLFLVVARLVVLAIVKVVGIGLELKQWCCWWWHS